MSAHNVRLYKESDLLAVQEIFTSGCDELISVAFYKALRQPHIQLLLLAGLLLPPVTTGSIVLSILGGIIVLMMLWFTVRRFFHGYAQQTVAGDLKDISKYYLQREGHCFWVVELEGEVVAIVGAAPSITPHEKNVELKRMAVSSHHRGKGIAKLLCRTVFDFARKNGCNAVILSTTTIHVNGKQLYEKMGFKPSDTDQHSTLLRLMGMSWVGYRYDISSSR